MIPRHYETIKQAAADRAVLCSVTKHRTPEEILPLYERGERIFGENRADELVRKQAELPADIQWHFIGHLQKNKVRMIMPYVSCIQSLDSLELAEIIEKEAARIHKTVDVLAELHLASEDTNKTGLSEEDAQKLIEACGKLEHIRVRGIMAMGPHTDDTDRIREVFNEAYRFYTAMQEKYGPEQIRILSMGMTDDYPIALECGSNMIRIGRYLFEENL